MKRFVPFIVTTVLSMVLTLPASASVFDGPSADSFSYPVPASAPPGSGILFSAPEADVKPGLAKSNVDYNTSLSDAADQVETLLHSPDSGGSGDIGAACESCHEGATIISVSKRKFGRPEGNGSVMYGTYPAQGPFETPV